MVLKKILVVQSLEFINFPYLCIQSHPQESQHTRDPPRQYLIGPERAFFVVFGTKDAKLELRFIPLIFATFCEQLFNCSF